MKSTNRTKKQAERTNINYRATFTGTVFATPVMFNPTADDLRRIKNIREDFDVNEPDYSRTIKDNEYRVVSLLLKYNPNKALKLKQQAYPNDMFVPYNIYISDRPVVGSNSGKTQIIDCHNQNAWIKLEGKTSLKKQIEKAQTPESPYADGDPLRRINPDTARIARQGEVALYDLVFKMSTLDKHKIYEEEPERSTRLDDFKLGENPTEVIENIFKGEYTALNMLIASNEQDFEGKDFFVDAKTGENNRVGIMLGVRSNDSGDRLYQEVLAPFTAFPVGFEAMYRPTDRTFNYEDEFSNGVALTESKLNKKAVDHMTHEEYPWKCFWNNSFKFQEVTVEDLEEKETTTAPPADATADADDDLPF